MSVVIETTIGDITVDLYLKDRPQTCLNFLKLCKVKYYNLCLIYKVEKNFIAQTGDPTATGRGGESIFCHLYGDQANYFDAEFKPRLKHEKLGTLSMVNNGNNMNGSQFFLTLSDNLTYLDENHTVFGEVAEGFDVLLKLNDAICDNNNRPYKDIRITHTVVLHDPFEDPKGLNVPNMSPEPTKEMLESGYIGADEEIDDTKGKTAEEIEEKIKESEAKARATILEMVGDIPEADVKPAENVLFVCKLNPVTTSEDLEVIFSRFGPILSCEVIKDKKTDESLQYAFIEFEKEEHCENAYFKMDNVLIDDRRIHVDFSQSVSKMNWNKNNSNNMKRYKSQDIILKNSSKKTDGYDLIFDMESLSDGKGHRSKSKTSDLKSESVSKYKNDGSKNKLDSSSHTEERKRRKEEKECSNYSDRRHTKYDKYYNEKDRSRRYRQLEYSVSTGKSRDSNQYDKQISRHSPKSMPRSYRNSDQYRKPSPELYSKKYKSSERRSRHDSVSPDRQKQKSYDRHRQQSSYDHSDRTKYSDKFNYNEYVKKNKKCETSHNDTKRNKIEFSHTSKDASEKSHSLRKWKKSKVRSSSASSSSSSSIKRKNYSKIKSTSSSDSDSSSSSSSSGSKRNKEKYRHQKRKESSDISSQDKAKAHKKRKHSS